MLDRVGERGLSSFGVIVVCIAWSKGLKSIHALASHDGWAFPFWYRALVVG